MNLKNLLILILLIFISCFKAEAVTDADYLSDIEQKLFNVRYNQDPIDTRLDRLEKNIFGKASNVPQQQRILKIKQIFNTAPPKLPAKTQKTQKKLAVKLAVKPLSNNTALKADITAQYPVVDEIEVKILGKAARQQDIYSRLNKLESTIFNRNFDDPLVDRVERLRVTVLGAQSKSAQAEPADNMDENSKNMIIGQLEKEVFNASYANESMDSRLTRLENKIFNQPCPDEPEGDRIERLAAVISAQPSTELYKDMNQVRKYQSTGNKITAAAMILLILTGLLL